MPDKPAILVDCTLRDGEQAAGVAFPRRRRLELAVLLARAGVSEIEAGFPGMGRDQEHDFREISRSLPGARVIAWSRLLEKDIEASARAEARTVHLSVPASELMLREKLGWERSRAIDELGRLLGICRRFGLEAFVGAEDASRADPAFVGDLARAAEEGGAARFRYADTLGAQDPFAAFEALAKLGRETRLPLEYHAHNDLGLATANALAALRAGAMASVTVLGLGERAGNASLEQVACASSAVLGLDPGLELPRLPELAALVAELSGRPVPAGAPVVGEAAFSHESGIHVDGILKDPRLYEFLEPAAVGRGRSLVPGPGSGSAALAHFAAELGYELDAAAIARLRHEVAEAWDRGAPADPRGELARILGEGLA